MKAGIGAAAAVALTVSACSHGNDQQQTRLPQLGPTLPPASVIKDGLLYAAVKARLAGDDIDSATRVSVVVHDGVVTLRGVVKDAATRAHEVQLVRRIRGVRSVSDELRVGPVGPGAAQSLGNAAVVAAVAASLAAQTGVNAAAVKIGAQNGVVTLRGTVPTAAVKATMLDAARHATGVRSVVDRIVVE